jgi:hypothetical protein
MGLKHAAPKIQKNKFEYNTISVESGNENTIEQILDELKVN